MSEADREARLRSTLDSLLEGAQIIDRQWRYAYINPAAARHGGTTVDALLGRAMVEAYPGIDQTDMFSVLRRAMETREHAELENEFVTPDGTAKWFQLVIQPVPEGLFILSLDITDRKRAEEALEKTRARFEAIIENLHEGLIVCDLQGNLLHWNRAALTMLGFSSRDDARGAVHDFMQRFDLFTLDGTTVPDHERPLARALRGEEFDDLELRIRRRGEESERIFAYSGSIARYAEDESLAYLTIRDITERKELERQFLRAQRMESIGTLAGGIAHDLNNVLMPILLSTTLLRRANPQPENTRTVDNIERSAKRGADLVRQILTFARGATPWSAAIDLRQVIADVEPIVRSTFPKTITFSVDLDDDLHAVSGDPTQLLQVLLNLAVNARDAMPNGGRIRVAARNSGHFVLIEVSDDGIGMSADVVARIFDPFFTTKDPGKGTGLGLFTVQDIVRNHGGFINVSSEIAKGSTFSVYLPAAESEAIAASHEVEGELPRGHGEVVMIVDDEISIIAVAQETLEAFGYNVITAQDGAQAIALFARPDSEVSLVITDMTMGVIDGAALIAALLRMNPNVPIVATSGTSSDDWMARARTAGAKRTLAKPYTAPLLLRLVASVLAPE